MIKMKYIRFEDDEFIFIPESQKHSNFVPTFTNIVSAGFVNIFSQDDEVEVKAYGKSVSLGIESREDDTMLISIMLKKD